MSEELKGKKIHMLGVCGTGMSALAGLLKERGALVSGSDNQFYPPIGPMLRQMGVTILEGYDPQNIPVDVDLFVVGNVVGRGNAEVEWLLNSGRRYESMAEALYRWILVDRSPVVVAGTHGKTTTTAFLAYLFSQCGREPGYFIAGNPQDLDQHHHLGRGRWFFVEGDEYETAFFDRASKFLRYRPRDLILTALEHDHVDFFPDASSYQKAFANLINSVPGEGVIIYNQDYPMAREVIRGAFSQVISYGFNPSRPNGVIVKPKEVTPKGMAFTMPWQGRDGSFFTPLLGRYNLLNLCAGILYGFTQGLGYDEISEAVATFRGVERRMTLLGERGKTLFYEDFAHHPTAISSAIMAVKEAYPQKRIVTVLEPRSWSLRRNRFADGLQKALSVSDEAWICEIYQKEKLPEAERLDVNKLAFDLNECGVSAFSMSDPDEIAMKLSQIDLDQERVVLLLSNGAFGGLPEKLRRLCSGR